MEFRAAKGLSLISMMVGLLVTTISMLAMMALYKASVFHIYNPDTGSETDSIRNQQNMAGLLTIQSLLQNAGFGITDATSNTHFILVDGAALAATTGSSALSTSGTLNTISYSEKTGNAVFWEENTALSTSVSDYSCHGLLSDSDTFAVYSLISTTSCDTVAAQWASQEWNITRIIKPDVLSGAVTFSVLLNSGKCSPFDSEIATSILSSNVSTLDGLESDSSDKAGLQVSVNWSQSSSYTPWSSCLLNFSD